MSVDDVWTAKCLPHVPFGGVKDKVTECDEENTRNFPESVSESWINKFKNLKEIFEMDMSKIINSKSEEIKLVTRSLVSEMNDLKEQLCKIKEYDEYKLTTLKNSWMNAVNTWKIDVKNIEKETTKKIIEPIGSFIEKLILTRREIDLIPDVLMALILEINHVILGNAQVFEDTSLHLSLLWQNYFRQWKIDYMHRTWDKEIEEEEHVEEEDEEEQDELFSERFDMIQNEMQALKERKSKPFPEFIQKKNFLHFLQHLGHCCENVKRLENITIECMESEYKTLLTEKQRINDAIKHSKKGNTDKTKLDEAIFKYNQYEERFADLAFSTNVFFETTGNTMTEVVLAWNSFLEDRLEPMKYLTLKRLKRIEEEHNETNQLIQESLNVSIDQLRSAPSIPTLEQIMERNIKPALQDLQKSYNILFQEQFAGLDEFYLFAKECYEVFIASLDTIIYSPLSMSFVKSPPSTPSRGSDQEVISSFDVDDQPFLNMMEFIVRGANNWYSGFMDSLGLLRSEIEMNITDLENEWTNGLKEEIMWKSSLIQQSIECRLTRINADIFNIRAVEIKKHEDILMAHAEGVHNAFSDMRRIEKNFEDHIQFLEENYEEAYRELLKIKDVGSDEKRYRSILQTIRDVKRKLDILQQRRNHLGSRTMALIERRMEWLHDTSVDILRNVRLFRDGGNYCTEEATAVIFTLNRLNADSKKETKTLTVRIKKILKKKVDNLFGLAEKIITGMKNKSKEVAFRMNLQLTFDRTRRAIKRQIMVAQERIKRIENMLEAQKRNRTIQAWDYIIEEVLTCSSHLRFFYSEEERSKSARGKSSSYYPRKLQSISRQRMMSSRYYSSPTLIPQNFIATVNNIIRECKITMMKKNQNFIAQLGARDIHKRRTTSIGNEAGDLMKMYEDNLSVIRQNCQIVWLNLIYDFLCLIFLFKIDLVKILESKCDLYKTVCCNRLKHIEERYKTNMNKFEDNIDSRHAKLKGSLKAQFGILKNTSILDALEEEAYASCSQAVSHYKYNVNILREEIKGFIRGFTNISKTLANEIDYFVSVFYMNKDIADFLQYVEIQIKKMPPISKKPQRKEVEEYVEEEEFRGFHCPMQGQSDLNELLQMILELLTLATGSNSSLEEKPIDCESTIVNLKKELFPVCRKIVLSAIDAYKDFGLKIQKWYDDWTFDIEEIKKLPM